MRNSPFFSLCVCVWGGTEKGTIYLHCVVPVVGFAIPPPHPAALLHVCGAVDVSGGTLLLLHHAHHRGLWRLRSRYTNSPSMINEEMMEVRVVRNHLQKLTSLHILVRTV